MFALPFMLACKYEHSLSCNGGTQANKHELKWEYTGRMSVIMAALTMKRDKERKVERRPGGVEGLQGLICRWNRWHTLLCGYCPALRPDGLLKCFRAETLLHCGSANASVGFGLTNGLIWQLQLILTDIILSLTAQCLWLWLWIISLYILENAITLKPFFSSSFICQTWNLNRFFSTTSERHWLWTCSCVAAAKPKSTLS